MRYADASVVILKFSVAPWLTLISVANPWMVASPDPTTSHCEAGLPGREFSHAIAFATGASHGPANAGFAATTTGTRASIVRTIRHASGRARGRRPAQAPNSCFISSCFPTVVAQWKESPSEPLIHP